ncbi:MAG: PIN domain-containing protein [Cyclobacteriaceae bacterium]|nr:PIN domain-containing protein [Cyclobacteriaceae bacterium]
MDHVLIDTDVILDFFFDRPPFAEDAAQLFSLCETNQIKGYVTPLICSNAYYLLRQTAKHEKVIEKLSQLMTIVDVLVMDKDVVIHALNSGFRDFEDALQNYTAVKSGIVDVILTRNVKDFTQSDLGVMTPESFLKKIFAAES